MTLAKKRCLLNLQQQKSAQADVLEPYKVHNILIHVSYAQHDLLWKGLLFKFVKHKLVRTKRQRKDGRNEGRKERMKERKEKKTIQPERAIHATEKARRQHKHHITQAIDKGHGKDETQTRARKQT